VAAPPAPVTPEVLEWAVGEDGRSFDELAEALRMDTGDLRAWLRGDERPSRGELTALAKVLRRPRAIFFLPQPPRQASAPPAFRHPPGSDRTTGEPSLRAYRRARRVQQAVAWARSGAADVPMPHASTDEDPASVGAVVRSWLGVTNAEQEAWQDDREALAAWRGALDELGVLVFSLEIGKGQVRGFSSWDAHAPMLAVNASDVTPAARVYTLAHELAHLVLRRDSACVEPPARPDPLESAPGLEAPPEGASLERWCEEFAAAFLMPARVVTSYMRQRGVTGPIARLEDVGAVKARFRVSARAAALRLIELGLAEKSLYSQVLEYFKPKPREYDRTKEFRRLGRPRLRLREYGPRAVATVMSRLPETDALSVLRITVEDARTIAAEAPGVDFR